MNPRRAIGVFLNRTAGPMITYILRTRIAPSESQIERELAVKYGRIADRIAGRTKLEGEPLCPLEHPSKAGKIVETVYELMKEEVEAGNVERDGIEEVRRRIREKAMRKLGVEPKTVKELK